MGWPSLITESNYWSFYESPRCRTHPIKFLPETIYGLENVVWRISRCLFSSDIWMEWFYLFWVSMLHDASHQVSAQEDIWFWRCWLKNSKMAVYYIAIFWYVSWMILAILSLHVALRLPSSFCLRQYMGWKMLFEEYQDASLVLISEWSDFIYSVSPCWMMHSNKFLLKRIYGFKEVVWKMPRGLFSAWTSFVSEWNERNNYESLFGLKRPIKFLLMRTCSLEEGVVWKLSRLLFSSWIS